MNSEPTIFRLVTGAYQVNTYIVSCPETKEGFIIDPGGDAGKILHYIEENHIHIKYILNTHGHADHILANKKLSKKLDTQVCIHEEDNNFWASG